MAKRTSTGGTSRPPRRNSRATADGGAPAASMADLAAQATAGSPAADKAQPETAAPAAAEQPDTPEPPPEPKCSHARVQRGRPHPTLLQVIASMGQHPGIGHRIKRWHRYSVGMSVLECRITHGLDHLDIGYYVKHGLMTLRPMTDAERTAALARWDGEPVPAQPAREPEAPAPATT